MVIVRADADFHFQVTTDELLACKNRIDTGYQVSVCAQLGNIPPGADPKGLLHDDGRCLQADEKKFRIRGENSNLFGSRHPIQFRQTDIQQN